VTLDQLIHLPCSLAKQGFWGWCRRFLVRLHPEIFSHESIAVAPPLVAFAILILPASSP